MPGFDIPDPFASFDPFKERSPSRQPGVGRPIYRQPLPADDFAALGKKALGAGASGVGYVLGSLDKPGQAVRGVLAGHGISALKNLVPFSDTMGLTDESDKVSGRDLTDKAGLTRKSDKGWGAWGTGLAADIATDPLTYMTFGAKSALTPAGAALKKAGLIEGMNRKSLLRGFSATEPELLKSGKSASDVAHMIAQKKIPIATQGMIDAAGKVGVPTDMFDVVHPSLGASSTGSSSLRVSKDGFSAAQKAYPGATFSPAGTISRDALEAGMPLASLARINIPFGPRFNVGTGEFSQKIAGGLDKTGDWLRFGNPLGRAAGSLFDRNVRGAVDAVTQRASAKYGTPMSDAFESEGRRHNNELLKRLNPLIDSGIAPEKDITQAATSVAEGAGFMAPPNLAAAVQPVADQIAMTRDKFLADAQKMGLPLKDAQDKYTDYVYRQALDVNHRDLQMGGAKGTRSFFPVASGSNIARKDEFRDIPGGSARINDLMSRYAGVKPAKPVKGAGATTGPASDIRVDLEKDLLASGRQMTPVIAKEFDDKANALANRIGVASPKYRPTEENPAGLPFFTPDIAATEAKRFKQHANTMTSAATAIGAIGDAAYAGSGGVPVHSLIKRLGLTNQGYDKDTGELARGALVQVYKALAPKGAANVDTLSKLTNKQIAKRVGKFSVSEDHAGQILKQYEKAQAPEQVKSSLGALDSFTNAFKALAYPIWLPSHVRNAATAGVNNATRGVGLKSYLDQIKIQFGMGGRNLAGYGADALPEAERAAFLRGKQYESAGIHGGHNATNEISGNAHSALENLAIGTGPGRFTPVVPGTPGGSGNLAKDAFDTVVKEGILGSAKAAGQTALNAAKDPLAFAPWNLGSGRASNVFSPIGIRGVNGAVADSLPAVAAGRKVGTQIENFFRGAQWNHHVRNGMDPAMAAQEVEKMHFNYDHLTDFEKNVMRRMVPFYTFARKNLPLQARTIASTPGAFNAQYKPFNQKTPGEDGYVPKYMASGVSVPVGPEVDGRRQYISKLGLPAEEAFERLHFKNGLPDLRATAMDYMGSINPIIKAPLEQLFNTQFHTQRRLTDLQAPQAASAIGKLFGEDNPQLLSQVLANSPLARFVTSADKLMDPRKSALQKAVNILTGVRVTDVDANKQRAIELRQALESAMESQPNLSKYSRFYVKPEDAANLTPEEIEAMRAYSQLGDNARAFAKEKRMRIGIKTQ